MGRLAVIESTTPVPEAGTAPSGATFAAARALFPGAMASVYMDTGARGLLSTTARAAVDAHLDRRMAGNADKAQMFASVESLRTRFAGLIGAEADEVAMTKNVSEGLNIIAAGIDWRAGDNVVLCPELEHPNNVYAWLNLQRLGVEVRRVAPCAGHLPVAAMIEAMDGRTRVLSVSSVTLSPGFRTDLAALGTACRARDVLFLVDAAQSVGILHTDVEAMAIDALAVSAQKGLMSLYGLGMLYCRRAWAERISPAYLARFGVDLGEQHEAALGGSNFALMPAARRFDVGNYNFAGTLACGASLEIIAALGTPAIEAHVCRLARRLAEGLAALDLPTPGIAAGAQLANLVCVGDFGDGGHDSVDDQRMASLHRALQAEGVRLSVRRGMLRFSLHLYNDDADVDRVLDIAQRWRRSAAA